MIDYNFIGHISQHLINLLLSEKIIRSTRDQQEMEDQEMMDQQMVDQLPQWCCPGHGGWEKRGRLWKHTNWCPSLKEWRKGVVEVKLLAMGMLEEGRLIKEMQYNARLGNWEEIVVGGQVWVECGDQQEKLELNRLWCSVESGEGMDDAFLSEGIVHRVGEAIVERHQDPPNLIPQGRLVHVWDPAITKIYVKDPNDRQKETAKKCVDKRKWKGLEHRLHSFIFVESQHFVVVHVDRDNRTIEFFDSLPGHLSPAVQMSLIGNVQAFLQLLDPDSVFTQVSDDHVRATVKCPEQSNNVDCGVMAILSIEAFVLNEPFPADKTAWQQKAREARVKLCYNIVEHNNFSLTSIPPPSAFNHF